MGDFCTEKKIYYHDTDCGGVVYYANYLKYLEEARTEYFLSKGVDLQKLSNRGIWFVVARVEIEYKTASRYQDTLRILTKIEKMKLSAIKFSHQVLKDDSTVVQAYCTLICVGNDYKPVSLPEEVKNIIQK
ncbi:MAG: hypothetical protein A2Y81_12115 [Nitrospirae bacterium RBG_13_43_8]|nr:MAG: hypothetical protein A2Y81_12115 [Nitrospirae bacterium RBG_13_43_8]